MSAPSTPGERGGLDDDFVGRGVALEEFGGRGAIFPEEHGGVLRLFLGCVLAEIVGVRGLLGGAEPRHRSGAWAGDHRRRAAATAGASLSGWEPVNKLGMLSSMATFFCARLDFNSARNSGVMTLSGSSRTAVSCSEAAWGTGGLIQERMAFQGKAILPFLIAPSTAPKGRPTKEPDRFCWMISLSRTSGQAWDNSIRETVKNRVSPAMAGNWHGAAGTGVSAAIGGLKRIGAGSGFFTGRWG